MSPANRSKTCAGFKLVLSCWYFRQTFFLRMSLFKARKYFRAKISTLKNSESNFSSWQNRPELHGHFSTIRSTGKVKLWIMLIVWWWDTSSMSYQPNGGVNRCKWTAQIRRSVLTAHDRFGFVHQMHACLDFSCKHYELISEFWIVLNLCDYFWQLN